MSIPDLVTNTYFQFFYMLATTMLAFYFYFKTRNYKRLSYEVFGKKIFDSTVFEQHEIVVSVTFQRKKISKLSRCYLLLSNGGNRSLVFKDDVNSILVGVPPGVQILKAGILTSDDKANISGAEIENQCAALHFDYLRVREGLIFFIDHTGAPNCEQITISAREKNLVRRSNYGRRFSTVSLLAAALFGVIVLGSFALAILIGVSAYELIENFIFSGPWRVPVSIVIGISSMFGVALGLGVALRLLIDVYMPARYGGSVVMFQETIKGRGVEEMLDEIFSSA